MVLKNLKGIFNYFYIFIEKKQLWNFQCLAETMLLQQTALKKQREIFRLISKLR